MILIGLGANLDSPLHGAPRDTLEAALPALEAEGIGILARSRWYRSAPVPASDQPWYVNGVIRVASVLPAVALLAGLHAVEDRFGRVRRQRWGSRVLDLDLLAYDDLVVAAKPTVGLILPHPRMAERAFVLLPLREVAPDWRHPVSGLDLAELIARLPAGQEICPLEPPD